MKNVDEQEVEDDSDYDMGGDDDTPGRAIRTTRETPEDIEGWIWSLGRWECIEWRGRAGAGSLWRVKTQGEALSPACLFGLIEVSWVTSGLVFMVLGERSCSQLSPDVSTYAGMALLPPFHQGLQAHVD